VTSLPKRVAAWWRAAAAARLHPDERDRGSMSLFFALTAVALLMVMGLLVDGGGALNAANRATSAAQEAARAAGQQLDVAQAVEGSAITLDPDAAVAAAQDYLAAAGLEGSAEVTDGGRSLTVNVRDSYSTYFAQFVGVGTISVTGTATAHLQTQAGG
jgi:Flp pilus assembly protein TadG